MALAPVKFPPFVTASAWRTCVSQLWDAVQKKRGIYKAKYPAMDGRGGLNPQIAPRLTNADVIRFVMAWLAATPRARALFPLAFQFAAVAYGWDPKTNRFDATSKQAARPYPDRLLVEFWNAMLGLASDLDHELVPNPRLDLDGEFSDPVFQGEVRAQLAQDGASAQMVFPLPICKGKDGKTHWPSECKRHAKTWPYLCEEYHGCKDPVIIKDPITDIHEKSQKALLLVALIVAAWWALDNQPRHRRK